MTAFFILSVLVFGLLVLTGELTKKRSLYLFAIPALVTFILCSLSQPEWAQANIVWFWVQPLVIGLLIYRMRYHWAAFAMAALLLWYPLLAGWFVTPISPWGL